MSSATKTVSVFLTLIGALVLALVGFCTHWPPWAWALGAFGIAVLLTAGGAVARRRAERFPRHLLAEPDLPIPPVERREVRVRDVALPSELPDYDFLFSATVRWCPVSGPDHAPLVNAGALAVDAVLARAQQVTAARHPARASLVQHELNGALGTMFTVRDGRAEAMAVDVRLCLSDADQERLVKLAEVRKNEAVWEHERKYEQSRRAYLGDDVLKDTGSAVVWALHRNDDKVDRTVQDIGLLAELTAAANNVELAERFHRFVPSLASALSEPHGAAAGDQEEAEGRGAFAVFSRFVEGLGPVAAPGDIVLVASVVADFVADKDPEEAERIRDRFVHGGPEGRGGPEGQEGQGGADDPDGPLAPAGMSPDGTGPRPGLAPEVEPPL
ncbi:hypothetical protein AB0910_23350 [Streptomyces sp. NPDC047002]|uniref:hypothetical protein n=1 Tax=Streptomyces sp. NPDC047002 TaxID=3155475 RepID=UPI0034523CB5